MVEVNLQTSAFALQVVQALLSLGLLLFTGLRLGADTPRSFYFGLQLLLFTSTLAATIGIVFIVHDDSLLDFYRAAAVRPEIIVAQFWIALRASADVARGVAKEGSMVHNDTNDTKKARTGDV